MKKFSLVFPHSTFRVDYTYEEKEKKNRRSVPLLSYEGEGKIREILIQVLINCPLNEFALNEIFPFRDPRDSNLNLL